MGSLSRTCARLVLGILMTAAGLTHLTVGREEFGVRALYGGGFGLTARRR
ncbi:hypothetical protein [Nocardioides acrostichi]|uniref:Uncharacterized protein n=1 Tax=Nocardioides acrostichi TaxID=2784339 RepID=A0A930UW84_9ACTN|nr:hypothetical protein [Nocardioides acrostichi]MBF4162018.1 hypothetical protein [Nocardioides acrostichi]